jgi:hypothetical protein
MTWQIAVFNAKHHASSLRCQTPRIKRMGGCTIRWPVSDEGARLVLGGIGPVRAGDELDERVAVAEGAQWSVFSCRRHRLLLHMTPGNARILQARRDSIIVPQALQTAAAVAGLANSAQRADEGRQRRQAVFCAALERRG